jgi:hypothetical protein
MQKPEVLPFAELLKTPMPQWDWNSSCPLVVSRMLPRHPTQQVNPNLRRFMRRRLHLIAYHGIYMLDNASKDPVALAFGVDLRIHFLDHGVGRECLEGSVLEFYLILPGVQYRIFVSLTEQLPVVSASPLGNAGGPRVPILPKQKVAIYVLIEFLWGCVSKRQAGHLFISRRVVLVLIVRE